MPYITQEDRKKIDPLLSPILNQVALLSKGEMNYIVSTIIARRYAKGGYTQRSEGASVLQDAHDEFYRRVVAPYEDQKCKENGDVFNVQRKEEQTI